MARWSVAGVELAFRYLGGGAYRSPFGDAVSGLALRLLVELSGQPMTYTCHPPA